MLNVRATWAVVPENVLCAVKPAPKSRAGRKRKAPAPEDKASTGEVHHERWVAKKPRLENIQIQGGSRPLFEFGAAPPPKA